MVDFEFKATIEAGRGGGAWVEVPFDVRKELGTGARVKVKATFDGEAYRGSLAPMGGGTYVLGILKAIRQKIGKDVGDTVAVTLARDTARRTVKLPKELQTALKRNPTARVLFAKLSYTRRKEIAEWVAGAKTGATRLRRVRKTIAALLKGQG